MNERIIKVRKAAGLSQEEFARRLGVTKSTVSGYETGRREPTDQTVRSICREFGINELWLKYGEGEIKAPAADGAIGQLISEFECTNFEAEFLKSYFALTAAERMEFLKFTLKVIGPAYKNTVGSGVNPFAMASSAGSAPAASHNPDRDPDPAPAFSTLPGSDDDVESLAEMAADLVREQAEAEKRRALRASSAKESGAG